MRWLHTAARMIQPPPSRPVALHCGGWLVPLLLVAGAATLWAERELAVAVAARVATEEQAVPYAALLPWPACLTAALAAEAQLSYEPELLEPGDSPGLAGAQAACAALIGAHLAEHRQPVPTTADRVVAAAVARHVEAGAGQEVDQSGGRFGWPGSAEGLVAGVPEAAAAQTRSAPPEVAGLRRSSACSSLGG